MVCFSTRWAFVFSHIKLSETYIMFQALRASVQNILNAGDNAVLEHYYIKMPYFRAQCRICGENIEYCDSRKVKAHILKTHDKPGQDLAWYVKYPEWVSWYFNLTISPSKVRCIMCKLIFDLQNNILREHLTWHSREELFMYQDRNVVWKYCSIIGDSSLIECTICKKRIDLNISPYVKQHIERQHLDMFEIFPRNAE